jgi:transposase
MLRVASRSADRRTKEQAMHEKFSARIVVALERLSARISHSSRRIDPAQVNRQIGRILQKNQRAATRFTVSLKDNDSPAGFYLHLQRNAEFDDWAEVSEGAYLLRSNITQWSDEQLWKAYIQLAQAEAAFRIQKDQLQVRPIWHQRADRVQAHILVCFLAFVLWKTLELWQQRAGLGNSPRTVLDEIARIQSHDLILPTTTHGNIRLRYITQPDSAQGMLLERLGLVLPKRMRLTELDPPAVAPIAASA